jgi:hypothetical protein
LKESRRTSLEIFGVAVYDNPTAAKAFETQIAALKTEQDVLKFAFALEQIAAQTYQGVGMKLSTPMLRQTAMTDGGVEARHMPSSPTSLRR